PTTAGGRRPKRHADGSESHRAAEPAGGGCRSGSGAGVGVGRRTVGTAGFYGWRRSDERVRTLRGGNGANGGLFVWAGFRHGGKRAIAGGGRRSDRWAHRRHGDSSTGTAGDVDTSVDGTG